MWRDLERGAGASESIRSVSVAMRHGLYEDPITHRFAVFWLPPRFMDGDEVPIPPTARWFATREQAIATLFDQDEDDCVDAGVH